MEKYYTPAMRATFFIAVLFCISAVQGGEESSSVSDYDDCAEAEVNFDGDDKIFTVAEMTTMMDKALYEALSRFDRCQTSSRPKGSSTELDTPSSTSEEQAGVEEDGDSETGTVNSTASTSASGVELPGVEGNKNNETGAVSSTASKSVSGTEVSDAVAKNTGKSATSKTSKVDDKALLDNGKLPDDILSSDNDSVFQAQVREAAKAEQDPERKAALWAEYRKLKGLPPVEEK